MKRALMIIAAAFALAACGGSSDDPLVDNRQPETGQYIGKSGNVVAAFDYGGGAMLTVFVDGKYEYQGRALHYSGSYPDYSYDFGSCELFIKFSSAKAFTVTSALHLETINGLKFVRDNTVLDKNGDGILDSVQGL